MLSAGCYLKWMPEILTIKSVIIILPIWGDMSSTPEVHRKQSGKFDPRWDCMLVLEYRSHTQNLSTWIQEASLPMWPFFFFFTMKLIFEFWDAFGKELIRKIFVQLQLYGSCSWMYLIPDVQIQAGIKWVWFYF